MPIEPSGVVDGLSSLRSRLDARAAGAWRVEGDRLIQLAFDAAPDLPADVAARFAAATVSVPLDRLDLGIVEAVVEARRAVFVVAELPPDAGSGYWLRAFGADRSVAVPILSRRGTVAGVVAVALEGMEPMGEAVEALLREGGSPWFDRG